MGPLTGFATVTVQVEIWKPAVKVVGVHTRDEIPIAVGESARDVVAEELLTVALRVAV